MGVLDTVAGLWRSPPSLSAAVSSPARIAPPLSPQAVPGGGNVSGRLMFEPNAELRDQAGFGRAGTYDVGQWESISLTNPYVTAGLDFVVSPVADARIDIEPPKGIAEAQARAMTDFLRWNLTEHLTLTALLEQAARGFLLSGFSLFEPVYEVVENELLPGRKGFALKDLQQCLPNSLHPNPWLEDETGHLTGIRQLGPRGGAMQWLDVTLLAAHVLLFSWKRKANNWAGESQFRSVWYIAGKVMPTLLKLVGVSLQREAAGIPAATAEDPKTPLSESQRVELIELFANSAFHESSGVVMPPGWDIEWIYSPGANKGHVLDAYNALGLVVLQQLSAQQLVLGTGATGSRSVGEVHDARSMAFVRSVLRFSARVLNGTPGDAHTGLVRRLIDFNFGPQVAYPTVKLTPQRPELSPTEMAAAAAQGKTAGLLTVTPCDENTFRERLGFSPIDEEQRAAAKEAARLAAPAPFGAPETPADEPPPAKASLKASAPRAAWQPWRPLRASEKNLQLTALDAYLTKRREDFEKRAKPVVVGMLAMAAPAIQSAMADGSVTPAEVAAVPLDEARLKKLIAGFLAETRQAGSNFVRDELKAGTLKAAEEEQDDRDAEQQAKQDADEVTDAEGERLRKRMVNRLRSELEREAIDTLRTGGDASEVVSRTVSRQIDSGAFKADAGSVTAKVFNVGRDEAARLLGGVESCEYSAILDNGTCDVCRAADGTVVKFNSSEHDALTPPNRDCAGGDGCRCLWVYLPGTGSDGEDE